MGKIWTPPQAAPEPPPENHVSMHTHGACPGHCNCADVIYRNWPGNVEKHTVAFITSGDLKAFELWLKKMNEKEREARP